jgi:prepilin-type N-terminal cleavage/methylation domain-containing protein
LNFLNHKPNFRFDIEYCEFKEKNTFNQQYKIKYIKSPLGFTLIELMSALAIFSILTLSLYIVFDRANKIWRHGEISTEHHENARTALDMMAREITSAIIATGGPTSFANPIYRPYLWSVYGNAAPDYDRDEIYFIFNRGNALYEVGYYIDEKDPSTDEDNVLKRAYSSETNTDFDISDIGEFSSTPEDVAFKITDLNFKFIYKSGPNTYTVVEDELESPNRAWDTRMPHHTGLSPGPTASDIDDGKLPDFIEISVRMYDKDAWEIHEGTPPRDHRKEFKVMIPMNQRSLRNE